MIKLSELQAMDHARGNNLGTVVRLVAILALPPFSLLFGILFVCVGIDLFNEAKGTTETVINCIFIAFGVAVVFFGLLVPVKIFKGVMAVKKNTYRVFRENDVIVDARCKKMRGVDRLALDRFDGALKPALCYVVESPDLSRQERYSHIIQWTDYEKDYVMEIYGRDLLSAAKESRKNQLTYSAVFGHLTEKYRKRGNKPFTVPPFRMVKATCVGKRQIPGSDGDVASHWLGFGAYGAWEGGADLFNATVIGDAFYLVLVDGKKGETISRAYAAFEWDLDSSLEGVVEE